MESLKPKLISMFFIVALGAYMFYTYDGWAPYIYAAVFSVIIVSAVVSEIVTLLKRRSHSDVEEPLVWGKLDDD